MKNSITLPDGIVHFWNVRHTGPSGRAFSLGVKNKSSAVAQPQQGIERGALSFCSRTFAPARTVFVVLYIVAFTCT